MSKLITIYTQAYNVEQYIDQCIKSVMTQTYRNFEWLLIENGSTDKTRDIIRKYAGMDERIKVNYYDKNRTGFGNDYIRKYAKGEYLVKLDSDDWIETEYLEKLIYPMEQYKADISICGALDFEEKTGKEFAHEYGELEGVYEAKDIRDNFVEMRSYMGTYWGKMMRKNIFCEILPDHKAVYGRLRAGNSYGGDTAFMLRYFARCKTMAFISDRLYHYRIRSNSWSMQTISPKRLESYMALRDIEKEFLKVCSAETEQNTILIEMSFWTNLEQLFKRIINSDWTIQKKIKALHTIYMDSRVKEIRKENYNSKVRTILSTYAAWYFMNMGEKQNKDLRDVLILLEPDIFVNITDDTYEWMSRQKELMAYIIVGEYAGAREYVKKIMDESNTTYISDLLKWLGS